MTRNPFSSWSRPRSAVAALSILSLGALSVGCTLVVPASRRTADFGGQDAPTADVPTPDVPLADVPGLDAPDAGAPDVPTDVPPDVPGLDAPCTLVFGYTDLDGDGYGAGAETSVCMESGATLEDENTDCDDSDRDVYPGAVDATCDGVNADCDAVLDPDETSANEACAWGRCVAVAAGGAECDLPGAIDAGWYHTCVALEQSGDLWCWGRNDDGEFGTTTPTSSDAPVALGVSVDDFCTTANATCFIAGGRVRCFGNVTPGFPAAFDVARADAAEITCGPNHFCVRSTDGAVRCAGLNAAAQCGVAASTARVDSLSLVTVPAATQITAGANFSCAVVSESVYCWGADDGILGRGTGTLVGGVDPTAAPVMASGARFAEVEAMNFATCARTISNAVLCWGYTPEEQVLGHTSPPDFVTSPAATAEVFSSLHGGAALHACGLRADGTVECWGTGYSGALGRADGEDASPDPAMPGRAIQAIDVAVASAGPAGHTCAIERDGRVACWGSNVYAQCGAPMSPTPITVAVEVIP